MAEVLKDYSETIEKLREQLGDRLVESRVARPRRVFIEVKLEALTDAIKLLMAMGFNHVSTITGLDLGENLALLYHIDRQGLQATLTVRLPVDAPRAPTVTDILPAAVFYEREIHDLLGVVFEGHPDLSRFVLPEKWPEGLHPLRKRHSADEVRRILDEGVQG